VCITEAINRLKRINGKGMDKMVGKKRQKRQVIILLFLSVLVLVCIFTEARQRGMKPSEKKAVQKEYMAENSEKKEKQGKKKADTGKRNVRVLLKTDNFASLYHKKVKITSNKPFTVTVDGKKKAYQAGKTVSYRADDSRWKKKKISISPEEGAKLQIQSIKRQNIHPSYRRTLQLTWSKQGFLVINRLPLEEYLYAVVPSELSTKSNMEALKAQAVCARSYAYQQIQSKRYEKYHADLDDSVACQVYNNVPEDKNSRKAVNSTRGMVLTNKKNAVVQTYYYSTSWGYSASGQDVWNTASEVPYLKERLQITEKSRKVNGIKSLNLSSEKNFSVFMAQESFDTYDSDSEWYRWNVDIDRKALSDRIDSMLYSCYASNPDLVLTQKRDGSYKKEPLKSIGEVKKLRVEKREKSGLVTELVIVGKKNVVKVCTQYNIRKVLAPIYEPVHYNDGKSKTTMSLLPSAAFYIVDAVKEKKVVFQLIGGGFGHGAGMSQCGAEKMACSGKNFRAILAYYFEGTKISDLSALQK